MPLLISVQQAAMNALKGWLQSSLPRDWKIDARWPDPDRRLPSKAVTVIMSGPVQWIMTDPVVVDGPFDVGIPGSKAWTWRLRTGIQPIQLDLWSNSAFSVDDMAARIESVLNAGESATGTNAAGQLPSDPFRNGILLKLQDGWSGNCDFVFNEPEIIEDPTSVQRSEYRYIYHGEAIFNLTGTATSVQLAQVTLKELLSEQSTPPSTTKYDNFTFGATGKATETLG